MIFWRIVIGHGIETVLSFDSKMSIHSAAQKEMSKANLHITRATTKRNNIIILWSTGNVSTCYVGPSKMLDVRSYCNLHSRNWDLPFQHLLGLWRTSRTGEYSRKGIKNPPSFSTSNLFLDKPVLGQMLYISWGGGTLHWGEKPLFLGLCHPPYHDSPIIKHKYFGFRRRSTKFASFDSRSWATFWLWICRMQLWDSK